MSGGPGGAGLSRRTLLRGAGGVAFVGASLAALKLPFFGVSGAQQDPATCYAKDVSATDKKLIISNWPAYIDPIHKPGSTVSVFEKQTGISVQYTDDVNDNAEFYAKVKNQLASCQSIQRDMIVMTDWMAARMIGLGWIQPLDLSKTPNFTKNLIPRLRDKPWDPGQKHHAPWQSGLTGIAYNADKTKPVESFTELLTRLRPQGQGHLADRDARHDGLHAPHGQRRTRRTSPRTSGRTPSTRCTATSPTATCAPSTATTTSTTSPPATPWRARPGRVTWSSPSRTTRTCKFVVPEEGMSLWADNMLIPNLATHQTNAEEWINYYYDPKVAAQLADWNWYICPVLGAQEEMLKLDKQAAKSPLIFPTDKMLENTWGFMALNDQQEIQYERDWADVTSG